MAGVVPAHPKGRVDRAGSRLIDPAFELATDAEECLSIINNWRAAHTYPLLALRMTLHGRARRVDEKAIVAQRLKRLRSIGAKLEKNPDMKLSQMQDIGGCRAVVATVKQVGDVVKLYEDAVAKNPNVRAEFVKKYDYIAAPKDDGYRGIHFVYKYRSAVLGLADWNGLRIEIQIRSRLQHAWATAVETVDLFTNQSLKTGGGHEEWKKFFNLMGSSLALTERTPLCPRCPSDPEKLKAELREATKKLNVSRVLGGWAAALKWTSSPERKNAKAYLLFVDANKDVVSITSYDGSELAQASEAYLKLEKEIKGRTDAQAVLVSADSLRALKAAFPNYFADTAVFVQAMKRACGS